MGTMPTAAFVVTWKAVALLIMYMALIEFVIVTPVAWMGQLSVCWGR